MTRIAAIDLGSNALRFIIAELDSVGRLKLLKKLREPVRLGIDVFTKGLITPETETVAMAAFKKFKACMDQYDVQAIKAVATSATRDASNGVEFTANIKQETGIELQIIDGLEEARLIQLAVFKAIDTSRKNILLIDIGGGSVEVTFSERNQLVASESFKMGTLRLLEQMKKLNLEDREVDLALEHFSEPLRGFIHSKKANLGLDFAVGTGGNFEALGGLKGPLLGTPSSAALRRQEVREIREKLLSYSFEEKVSRLGLPRDRADVIVPALAIIDKILDFADLDDLNIPYVGLKEGIIWQALEDS